MTKIYLDENLSEYVASALNSLNKGYFEDVEVHSTKIAFGRGVPDETLIPYIGETGDILITKDINIRRRKLQYDLCKEYGIGIFFLDMPKGQSTHWEMVRLLIEKWEDIIKVVRKNKRPFAYTISPKGKLRELI